VPDKRYRPPEVIIDRPRAIPRAGFPRTHLLCLMAQIPMKVALGKARAEWQAAHATSASPPRLVTALRRSTGGSLVSWCSAALVWLAAHLDLDETLLERMRNLAAHSSTPDRGGPGRSVDRVPDGGGRAVLDLEPRGSRLIHSRTQALGGTAGRRLRLPEHVDASGSRDAEDRLDHGVVWVR
jgi:hypothetical protein